MGEQAQFASSVTLGARSYRNATRVVEGDGLLKKNRSGDNPLPAAKVGSLTTRTDNDTGVLTMNAGHGILTGDRLDVYWDGGSRYGMVVGTVAGNSVPIDLGSGDNLPIAGSAITAQVSIVEAFLLTGNQAITLVVTGSDISTVVFRQAASDSLAVRLNSPDQVYSWDGTGTNPLAGAAVVSVLLSHKSSGGSSDVEVAVLYDD